MVSNVSPCCMVCSVDHVAQDVNLARDVHVHFFRGAAGSSRDNASTDCLRLLHLVDLYKVRYERRAAPQDSAQSGDSAWWWPVAKIQ